MKNFIGVLLIIVAVLLYFLTAQDNHIAGIVAGFLFSAGFVRAMID